MAWLLTSMTLAPTASPSCVRIGYDSHRRHAPSFRQADSLPEPRIGWVWQARVFERLALAQSTRLRHQVNSMRQGRSWDPEGFEHEDLTVSWHAHAHIVIEHHPRSLSLLTTLLTSLSLVSSRSFDLSHCSHTPPGVTPLSLETCSWLAMLWRPASTACDSSTSSGRSHCSALQPTAQFSPASACCCSRRLL